MKISIITVSYNAESTIRDTIESVLSQEDVELEYIIIDGGSSDDTPNIVRSYGNRISTFVSEPDKGIYDGMNKGVQRSTGDVVGILNADDIYENGQVLKKVLDQFKQDVEAIYADLVYVAFDDTNKITRTWISKPYKEGSFTKGWMPPHPTFFVKKTVYDKLGLYTLKLKSAADYEFMLRVIHKNKIRLGYLNEIIVRMRVGGESNASIKNRLKANKEDRLAWKMNNLDPGKLTFIRKPLSKVSQFLKR